MTCYAQDAHQLVRRKGLNQTRDSAAVADHEDFELARITAPDGQTRKAAGCPCRHRPPKCSRSIMLRATCPWVTTIGSYWCSKLKSPKCRCWLDTIGDALRCPWGSDTEFVSSFEIFEMLRRFRGGRSARKRFLVDCRPFFRMNSCSHAAIRSRAPYRFESTTPLRCSSYRRPNVNGVFLPDRSRGWSS